MGHRPYQHCMHSITFNLGLIHLLFRATDLTTRKLLHTRPSSTQHTVSALHCSALQKMHRIALNCSAQPSSTQHCFSFAQTYTRPPLTLHCTELLPTADHLPQRIAQIALVTLGEILYSVKLVLGVLYSWYWQ